MTLWIPALGEITYGIDPYLSANALFAYYLGLYSYIKLDDCVYYCFMYYPTILISSHFYVGGIYDLLLGLSISTIALVECKLKPYNFFFLINLHSTIES